MKRIPLEFGGRILPLGQGNKIQPYAGATLAINFWKYTETGEFVDFDQGGTIFRDTFENSGTTVGPVILFGVRYASDAFSAGFEGRYHWAKGDLDPADFVPTKIRPRRVGVPGHLRRPLRLSTNGCRNDRPGLKGPACIARYARHDLPSPGAAI
jgi:hypothetical protein